MKTVRLTGVLLSIWLFWGQVVSAHQIVLKNGRKIESPTVIENKSTVTYQKYGGEISIPRSEVREVIYTERKKGNAAAEANPALQSPAVDKIDLAGQLEMSKRPRNAIERANMCSVYIETAAGAGSGFFISDDGMIITNRHVVRGSSVQKMQVSEKLKDADQKFNELRRDLDREQERIDRYEQRIRRKWQEYERYKKTTRTSIDRQQLADFRKDLLDHEQELRRWKETHEKRRLEYEQGLGQYTSEKKEYYQRQEEQEGQYRFTITLADGTKQQAVLYKVSDTLDLALLKLNGYTTPYLQPARRSEVALGDPVYAIGAPLNLANSVTSGVLSSYRNEYVQTNAEIYPGNSGGPLVTKEGKVLGVNTMKLLTEKFEGLGFAIRIDLVLQQFEDFL